MKPFEEHFDYEASHRGYPYAVRVGSDSNILTAEIYFRVPPHHKWSGLPAEELDQELPETVAAIYGGYDEWGFYWSGVQIAPDQFEDSIVFAETFLDYA